MLIRIKLLIDRQANNTIESSAIERKRTPFPHLQFMA